MPWKFTPPLVVSVYPSQSRTSATVGAAMSTITTSPPPIPHLPPESMQLGADPRLLRDELAYLIMLYATNAPRSRQTTIGPSEIGTPCTRRLAFMVTTGRPSERGASTASWRSSVGTAVH